MAEYLAVAAVATFAVLILIFGPRLSGKSWHELVDQFAQEIQQLRQSYPRARVDSETLRDLTILAIACIVLALELSWLATQI